MRLYAADILSRRALTGDDAALTRALAECDDKWLRLALEDAQCTARGVPHPERTRLHLGRRTHTEGGDLPNGLQLWLGNLPKDPAEARKLVDQGYRFAVCWGRRHSRSGPCRPGMTARGIATSAC